jgi:iron complex outermembrane recepter protein
LIDRRNNMSEKFFKVFLVLVIGLIFVFGDTSFLCAQETSQEEFTLEEITVTASKRSENQQKVPIAMDVISSQDIKELGKNNIDEILSGVSNTIIEKSRDGYRIAIRGITDSSQPFHGMSTAQPAVAVNTDGVYSNRKDTVAGLFDIDRVEVLYGPQSTMYSSNSPGGIVNVVTAQPKLDTYSVSGVLEAGNYGLLHAETALNAPIGNKIALRASAYALKRNSYVSNSSDKEDTKSARLRALFQPSDKLSFTLTGEYSKDNSAGFSGVKAFSNQGDKYYPDGTALTNPWTGIRAETHPSNEQPSQRVTAQINWDTSIGSLSMVPSYTARHGHAIEVFPSLPGSAVSEMYYYTKQDARERAMETRITSPADFFMKWMLGVNLYKGMDRQRRDSADFVETGTGEWSIRGMIQKSTALYGNITYPLTDIFRLTAGYRKSWDKTIQHDEGMNGAPPGSGLPPNALIYQNNETSYSTGGRPDYKFGFEYDLGKNSMVYGDYSTSFRVNAMPGGAGGPPMNLAPGYVGQEGAGSTTTDDPEILKAYTIGAKNRFLDNRLQVNLAAYYYDYKNYMAGNNMRMVWVYDLNDPVNYPDNILGTADRNEQYMEPYSNSAGDGRMIGIDMSSTMLITQNDTVNLSVSYLNSKWTNLKMVYYYDKTLELVNGQVVTVTDPGADYTGKPMMSTPPWTVNLSYDHSFNLPNGGVLRATVSAKIRSAFRLSWADEDYPLNFQEGYHTEDFQLVYNSPEGHWNLSGFVKNIENYAEKRMYMSGMSEILTIGDPRTFGSVLSVKF